VSVLVLGSWPFATSPLRDLSTWGAAGDQMRLVHPPGYILLAPVCAVMDALTLLSVRQTLALLASLAVLYAVWRVTRRRSRSSSLLKRVAREGLLAVGALGVVVAVYAVAILVPRPMAALALDDPDLVAVDFHSHTSMSHDGRASFTARANRAWHRGAGFDVAYITDHKTYEGAEAAARANPARAGDGVVLLSGVEYVHEHNHLNAIGANRTNFTWIPPERRDSAALVRYAAAPDPVLIQTVPDHLELTPAPNALGRGGVLGIELSDGSPRGIEQGQRDRARILRIADSLDLAVVAGSDNHGWGRTAVGWSVMRIPGWRSLTPVVLGNAIERTIRSERRDASRVIGRRSPDPGRSALALAATLPAVAANVLVTLSPAERVAWLVWTWALAAIAFARAVRRDGERTRRPESSTGA
jgi:predicted metal-dependent phosphoesterase TrpH